MVTVIRIVEAIIIIVLALGLVLQNHCINADIAECSIGRMIQDFFHMEEQGVELEGWVAIIDH